MYCSDWICYALGVQSWGGLIVISDSVKLLTRKQEVKSSIFLEV